MSWVLTLAFTANVFAASPVQELERSLDAYQYSMQVEWDQKDQSVYSAKTEAFFAELGDLMKNGNVSKGDLIAMLEKKVTDKKAVASIKAQLSSVTSADSSAELAKILSENSDKFYSRGASWNGDVVSIGLGVLVVGVLAYAIWWSATHECVAYENQYVCSSTGGGYCGGSYGGGYYSGGYYNCGPQYVYCGYQDVCVEYAKK